MKKIVVGYASRASGTVPVWVAKEAGIFRELGIDAETAYIPGSPQVVQAILRGDVQFGNFAAPAVVEAGLRGAEVVILAGSINTLIQQLMARPPISRVEDLRGKAIGIPQRGDVDERILNFVLPRWGLRPDEDVALLEVGRRVDRLEAASDARFQATLFHPPDPWIAMKKGWVTLADLAELGVDFQLSCAVTTRSFLSREPELCRSYVLAYGRGVSHYKAHRDFTLKVLADYGLVQDLDAIERTYDLFYRLLKEFPEPTLEGIRNILGTMPASLQAGREAKPEDFVDLGPLLSLERDGLLTRH